MRLGISRGTRLSIVCGSYASWIGTVEATLFQKTVDYREEYAHTFHVTLDGGTWVSVRRYQVMAT